MMVHMTSMVLYTSGKLENYMCTRRYSSQPHERIASTETYYLYLLVSCFFFFLSFS